jgi:hypothetical protein
MRLFLLLNGVLAARISRDDSMPSSSYLTRAVVDSFGNVGKSTDVTQLQGSARAQMLAEMQSRVSSLVQAKLTPEAKSVITDTLLPTVDNEIAASILKEFTTTQQLLTDKVAALRSSTSAAVAGKSRADQEDTALVTCRETQKTKISAHEDCEDAREKAIADLNQQCEEKRAAATKKKGEKEAAATFDLGSAVCSPETCDVAADPTCGLGDLAESVQGLQAQVKLKVDHYNKLTQELAEADGAAVEACTAAEKYPVENDCSTEQQEAREESQRCTAAHETADLGKCSFGVSLQGKCADLSEVRGLISSIKAADRTDTLSEPDRQQEWSAVQRLKCVLEALRDDGDLSQDAAAQCAADESRQYPKEFDFKEAEIQELTTAANFACSETTISFSGYRWTSGGTSAEFTKFEDTPQISLVTDTQPFGFCGGEELLVGEDLALQKGTKVGEVDASQFYEVSFTITPHAARSGWGNIIHLSQTGKNCCDEGDRMPAVWFRSETTLLYIRAGRAGKGDDGCNPEGPLPVGKASKVTIRVSEGKMQVFVDGEQVCESSDFQSPTLPSGTMEAWAADPWHWPANATLSRLTYTRL